MGKTVMKFPDLTKILRKLDQLTGECIVVAQDVLLQAAETVQEDVREAVSNANLPAQGKYSKGETAAAICDPHVETDGYVLRAPIGFDFSKGGAGGYLISGTPHMKPDNALHRIFREKKYMKQLEKDMVESVMDKVEEALKK